jgi:asparagine synthase (glutamine-hydrolysing)
MCGIAGFMPPGPAPAGPLQAMLSALTHRGPDAAAWYADAGIALAHTRLAVIDLDGGAQPRIDPGTGDALVFNGEIYNFSALADELRAAGADLRDGSDTEVLFQYLRRHGVEQTLDRLDGMFAFAFRDGCTGTLYLARDRFGEKPLYYAHLNETLVFGSEAGAILCHPALRPATPDIASAYALLQFEYLPGKFSGWVGIEKLPAASLLVFSDKTVKISCYWSPPRPAADKTEADVIDRLDFLLCDAVRAQIVADVPLGIFLSGGLDSSLLTAIAAREIPGITALTVRAGSGSFDETSHAIAAARHIGVRHEIVDLSSGDFNSAFDAIANLLSEPLADSSLLPTYLVCRAARARMTVALGGDGADELFGGYPNFHVQRFARIMAAFPRAGGRALIAALDMLPSGQGYMNIRFRLAQLAQGFGHRVTRQSYLWMAPFGEPDLRNIFRADIPVAELADVAFAPIDEAAIQAGGGDDIQQLLHQFVLTYLPDDILQKTDRAAMFNGLEVRAPFLHRPLAEFAASLPHVHKMRAGSGKQILKALAVRYLPPSIVHRKKHGFAVPIGHLLRVQFRERVADTLLSPANPAAAWFNRVTIETMLAAHLSGRRDYGKRLWALLILFTVAGRRAVAPPIAAFPASVRLAASHE